MDTKVSNDDDVFKWMTIAGLGSMPDKHVKRFANI